MSRRLLSYAKIAKAESRGKQKTKFSGLAMPRLLGLYNFYFFYILYIFAGKLIDKQQYEEICSLFGFDVQFGCRGATEKFQL